MNHSLAKNKSKLTEYRYFGIPRYLKNTVTGIEISVPSNFTFLWMHTFLFFAGTSPGCAIRCNFRALQNEDYKTIGEMFATIIIQGGEHPHIFTPSICNYIAKGLEFCQPHIEEVPDAVVRASFKKVVQ